MMKLKEIDSIRRQARQYNVPILQQEKSQWLLDFITKHTAVKVLELGCAIGYSGIILGSRGAHVITVEMSAKDLEKARKNFKKFGTCVTMIYGDAVEQMKFISGEFDLIFIDFMNRHYIDVFKDCMRLVKRGGWIIADNVNSEKCADFKMRVLSCKGLETEIVEIGDGMSVSLKKK